MTKLLLRPDHWITQPIRDEEREARFAAWAAGVDQLIRESRRLDGFNSKHEQPPVLGRHLYVTEEEAARLTRRTWQ